MRLSQHLQPVSRRVDWLRDWSASYQELLGLLFLICCGVAFAADLWLVLVLDTRSISLRTWQACQAHPTIPVGGILLTLLIAWLVRGDRRLVVFSGILGGHLFTHF